MDRPLKLSTNPLSQENPKTDGRYVVWQGRQPNGGWNIWMRDMESVKPAEQLMDTDNVDESNPPLTGLGWHIRAKTTLLHRLSGNSK